MVVTCKGVKIDGSKCTRTVVEGEYCHQHALQKYRELKPAECAVCFENLENERKSLDCGHWIHRECVIRSGKSECPICRAPVTLGVKATKALNAAAERHRQDSIEEDEQDLIHHFEEHITDLILQALEESDMTDGVIEMNITIPEGWDLGFEEESEEFEDL